MNIELILETIVFIAALIGTIAYIGTVLSYFISNRGKGSYSSIICAIIWGAYYYLVNN